MDDFISEVIDILVSCGIDYGDSINKFIAVLMLLFYILCSFFKIVLNCLLFYLVCEFILFFKDRYAKKPEL